MNEQAQEREYVVQRAVVPTIEQSPEEGGAVVPVVVMVAAEPNDRGVLWEDIAVVPVGRGRKRRTIIEGATREITDEELPQFFRALDPDSGEVFPLRLGRPKAPPPRRMVG